MTLKGAWLDDVEGFATAYVEKLPDAQQVIVGTFKGERTFHDARKGSSARMVYQGLVEDEGAFYRVEVPVTVRIQARAAKFRADGPLTFWEKISDD
jgi:hypothetical protein